MKRARILLTATAIVGVIGSALAFKVKNTQTLFCSHPVDRICRVPINEIKTNITGRLWECTNSPIPLTTTWPPIVVTGGL